MADAGRILIVEDDAALAEMVAEFLRSHGFEAEVEGRGDRAAARILRDPPALVVLDVALPGTDGFGVCREVRGRSDVPILMLTARGDERDEIAGLAAGADDYVSKPVRPALLLARVRALLRRLDDAPAGRLEIGTLVVDGERRVASVAGAEVELTSGQPDLLWLLPLRDGDQEMAAQAAR